MQFAFDDHVLDTDRRELRRGSDRLAVEPQVFDLLVYLLENCDRVVSKNASSRQCGAAGSFPIRL
jgi:DNA-binding winged helix-turn-helix (wHTH) protein